MNGKLLSSTSFGNFLLMCTDIRMNSSETSNFRMNLPEFLFNLFTVAFYSQSISVEEEKEAEEK